MLATKNSRSAGTVTPTTSAARANSPEKMGISNVRKRPPRKTRRTFVTRRPSLTERGRGRSLRG